MTLCKDIRLVMLCYIVLLLAMGANVVLSLYYNVEITGESFHKSRLKQTFKKAVIFILGTILMVSAVDGAMILLTPYIPNTLAQMQEIVTVAMIISTIGIAVCRYIKDAYKTFLNILKAAGSERNNESGL